MKNILVTGAFGSIGRNLSKYLSKQGYNVYGLGHGSWTKSEYESFGITDFVNADISIRNLSQFKKKFIDFCYIYHLAGGSSVGISIEDPYQDFFKTVVSTEEVLEWVRRESRETKIVVISSAAVYGSGHIGEISESAVLKPSSPYGYHKMMMENLCRSYGDNYNISSVIVRLFSVYGEEHRKQLIWDICCRLENKESDLLLHGTGRELRDWTEISDVVRLLEKSSELSSPNTPIINGGSGKGVSILEIAKRLISITNSSTQVRFSGKTRIGDPISLISTPASIKKVKFDWKISLDQGLINYSNWFKRNFE